MQPAVPVVPTTAFDANAGKAPAIRQFMLTKPPDRAVSIWQKSIPAAHVSNTEQSPISLDLRHFLFIPDPPYYFRYISISGNRA
jgi:hypothetical protein